MVDPELIGAVAACLTTASFAPQAFLVIRTRNTAGISLLMYLLFTTGVACWLAYGLLVHSLPIIAANAVTVCLASIILTITAANRLRR